MSVFRVYGVTIEAAKKKAVKKIESIPKNDKSKPKTAEEYQVLLNEYSEEFYKKMSPVAVSGLLDSPTFAQDFIELAKKTHKCRQMKIKIHVQKSNKKGAKEFNDKTGKPLMTWMDYSEYLQITKGLALA